MTTKKELQRIAKNLNIPGYSYLKKDDLVARIEKYNTDQAMLKKLSAEEPAKETPKDEKPAEKPAQPKTRKENMWNVWLAEYCRETGIPRKEAMSHRDVYNEWKSKGGFTS